jgi:dipeptidyl aminopeptidase/acylaminoacyl peptidase
MPSLSLHRFVAALAFLPPALCAAAPRPLAVEDLYQFDHPTALALASDGRRAAYVRHWFEAAARRERHALWLVDNSAADARPLEKHEPDARAPVFSPDGKWIAFLSTRLRPDGWNPTPPAPSQSDPATDVWLIPATGGAAIPLAGPDKPYGRVFNDGFYGRLAFSPDGRRLAFVADDGRDARTNPERDAGVRLARPDQGEGYTGYSAAQVWVADVDPKPDRFAARRVERLTSDDAWYGDPQWSPDGKTLVVHANRSTDRESVRYCINKNYDLWALNVETRAFTRLTSGPGPEVSPRFSPDGRHVACLSVPRKGSHRDVFNLMIVTLGAAGPRSRIVFDYHAPDADRARQPPPVFPLPEDCWDGNDRLVYNAELGTETVTVRVELTTDKASRMVVPAASDADHLSTDSAMRLRQQLRLLTPAGDQFLRERLIGESRLVHWQNEGWTIEGILTLPPPVVAQPPYKLVVYPHGGPHSRSARGFDFKVQFFAAHGYAVFQPNFRGSSGYGQKFIDADHHDFGGGDERDILTGVDYLVNEGLVDPGRQFVYGVSYGGYMTTWLVGHTNQFRAAVAQNAVTDLNAMWSLSDLQSWTEWEFGGRPWEVPTAMREHSPMTYVGNVRTPTLILHARDDRRCPLPMGRMFHQALRARRVPTELVIYPGEGHGIRQPRHREDVLRRTLAWFDQYDRHSAR